MQGFLMIRRLHFLAFVSAVILCLLAGVFPGPASAQSSSSSSSSQSSSSGQVYVREKAPSLIDPAGPTISLIPSEPVFIMSAALNTCGYDEGLQESSPIRKHLRDEINQALAQSEDARTKRDALCLYIAQHRMTGSERDISQYISLALYLTPPPELEVTADLTEMPPDSTQVVEVLPALRAFAAAVDLHGIWLTSHHDYDEEVDKLHDPISQMIVNVNLYLKMPASTYDGRRFIVVVEPQLSPSVVNARVYGTDYVVVVSPVDGKIPMADVRHTYLHYVIDPLLYARSNAIDREQPILKEIRDAPLDFRFRSDTVSLTIECLIKAIEARTMDTGIPEYKIPANVDRSQLPIYEHQRDLYQQKVDAAKLAAVAHDMRQGYVLTQYFYEQLLQFEKDPASLKDTIGEMVYGMDVDQQVHRARQTEFDKEGDEDVLQQSKPHPLTGLDLAEAKLASGDVPAAAAMAQKVLASQTDTVASTADAARAHFILARVDLMTGHPDEAIDDFQKTLATSKEQRLLAWSHIYLGRMLDLECKRDEALAEYNEALAVRDGQLDTRLAAERGVKAAYVQRGHEHDCDDDSGDDAPGVSPQQPGPSGQPAPGKPAGAETARPESPTQNGAPKPE
jgi:tetratricopeptide (TPR) repeat protein